MIYTKPIDLITWDDIEEFCQQQIKESAYLDYKREFPNHLEKTLSAMANTLGGIILIGVEENTDNTPKTPILGINFKRGLSEKVTNIILTNLSPPLFPEIQICKNQDGDKAVIVIRIHPSHLTPHAINRNTKVYLRTGNVNTPEDLATLNDIEWLKDQRKKSTDLREIILANAYSRYEVFYNAVLRVLEDQNGDIKKSKKGILTLSICPLYPQKEFRTPIEMKDIPENIKIQDYLNTSNYFPLPNMLSSTLPRIVQDGVVTVHHRNKGKQVYYTEFNSFGMYFFRQPIMKKGTSFNPGDLDYLSGCEIIIRLDEFIETACKYLSEIEYRGYVIFKVSIDEVLDEKLRLDWIHSSDIIGQCPDDSANYADTLLVSELCENKDSLVFSSVQKLFWAFDVDFRIEQLSAFFTSMNRDRYRNNS